MSNDFVRNMKNITGGGDLSFRSGPSPLKSKSSWTPIKAMKLRSTPTKSVSHSMKECLMKDENGVVKVNAPVLMRQSSNAAGTSDGRFMPTLSSNGLGGVLLNPNSKALTDLSSMDPIAKQHAESVLQNLTGTSNIENTRVLSYHNKPAAESGTRWQQSLFSDSQKKVQRATVARYIPQRAEKTLDAPNIHDDFYLNLIDWSAANQFSAALSTDVYRLRIDRNCIDVMVSLPESEYYSSLKSLNSGQHMALGTSSGLVHLLDVETSRILRKLRGQTGRVPALAINEHVICAGTHTGHIVQHDVRVSQSVISTVEAHTQEICALVWSPDGTQLASGANDNSVAVWNRDHGSNNQDTMYLIPGEAQHRLSTHTAAVRALSWCPWRKNLLVTGGGSGDHSIQFHNTSTGVQIKKVATNSPVSGLVWNTEHRELCSSHGRPNNQLTLWSYPDMKVVAELNGHTSRVLILAASPDGTTVVSAGADETIKFWNCWSHRTDEQMLNESSSNAKHKLNYGGNVSNNFEPTL